MKNSLRKLLAKWVSRLPAGILTDDQFFDMFQEKGLHIRPVHFYEAVPDTRDLEANRLWDQHSELPGIDIPIEPQVELLRDFGQKWIPEYRELVAAEPAWVAAFAGPDGAMLYSMVREHKPNLIIEVGSGGSTLISAEAIHKNQKGRIVAIDPCPRMEIENGIEGIGEFIQKPVETVPVSAFEQLEANDILFIDSSHTVRIGGDVIYEICEILPRLKPGVFVHLHDIFLPLHYPREWVIGKKAFWAEQYLLQAFLAHNTAWRTVWSAGSMHLERGEELQAQFPEYDPTQHAQAASFWMVREN